MDDDKFYFDPCCGGDSKACMDNGPCAIERDRRTNQQKVFSRYVQKPVEACQITADNMHAIAEWCGGEIYDKNEEPNGDVSIDIGSKMITADVGDYIVKSGSGSFYKVEADSFEALYEQIWW